MPLDARSPQFDGHAYGQVYGNDDGEAVFWMDDHSVGTPPDGDESPATVDQLVADIKMFIADGLTSMDQLHESLLTHGWTNEGALRYDVQSGIFLQDARYLAEMSQVTHEAREHILAAAGGRHPSDTASEWTAWVDVTLKRRACLLGARTLALAAVEALVNEMLKARYPDEYGEWELNRRWGFKRKLDELLKLRLGDGTPMPEWYAPLLEHSRHRNDTMHHKPGWVRDRSPENSVAAEGAMTTVSLDETMAAVDAAIEGLFSLFGVPVPPTHQPGWLTLIRRA